MKTGTVKEIKTHEYRVGLVPASVRELVHHGHKVVVETICGAGVGFSEGDYERAGAPSAAAPKVLTEDIIKTMRTGSVVVDIAINQGYCFETSEPTSLDDPIYTKHGVAHYCFTNMPGAVDLRAINRNCAVNVTIGRSGTEIGTR